MKLITFFLLCDFEQHCLGKEACSVPMDRSIFIKKGEDDGCPGVMKTLAIQVMCGAGTTPKQ